MTRGRIALPRFRIHPDFRTLVRNRMRDGESARRLALAGLFPTPSVFSWQLHAAGIPKTLLNEERWRTLARYVGYEGVLFEEAE